MSGTFAEPRCDTPPGLTSSPSQFNQSEEGPRRCLSECGTRWSAAEQTDMFHFFSRLRFRSGENQRAYQLLQLTRVEQDIGRPHGRQCRRCLERAGIARYIQSQVAATFDEINVPVWFVEG